MVLEPQRCPICGGQTVPIIYGLPDPNQVSIEDVEAGRIVLGGCMVSGDEPEFLCRDCGYEWRIAAVG
jgi:hypothetical protein